MNFLIDENIPYSNAFFDQLGSVQKFAGRELKPEQLANIDVLLVRSITKVNEQLLAQANQLKFVGTATIGEDHIDKELLRRRNITFSSAPGCNANSVAEYVISSLLVLAEHKSQDLSEHCVVIVGYGNIGKNLTLKLNALGIKPLVVDPFEQNKPTSANVRFVSLEEGIKHADIITFHTPLTKYGDHPTYHLLNNNNFNLLKSDACIINASRGEVIDNQALLFWHEKNPFSVVILDVWENEPDILKSLIPHCTIATPHIAGYSLEGKANATEFLYQKICGLLERPVTVFLKDLLPEFEMQELSVSGQALSLSPDNLFKKIVHLIYDVRADHTVFNNHLEDVGFDWLRKSYRIRREWSAIKLKCDNPQVTNQFRQLGFTVDYIEK